MSLRLEIHGHVGHLLIDRAAKRNAFTQAMWQQVPVLLARAEQAVGLRLLVVRSAEGGAFCAGADIAELLGNKDDAAWLAGNQRAINAAQQALVRFALPVLAFVEGDCVGGGCAIAMACDLRVATPLARFGITPAKLGLVYPLHDISLLVDLVGPGQAKRLLFTGALVDAAEADAIGLVEIIAEDAQPLIDSVVASSPHSTRALKNIVRRVLGGQRTDDAETLAIFAAAFDCADFREGTSAFVEKRKPEFGG